MTSRLGLDDVSAIAADIDDMYEAFIADDRGRFDSHLHPQVTVWETHLPGALRGRAELDSYRNGRDAAGDRPQLSTLQACDKRIDVWGDTGVARYVLVAVPADGATEPQRTRVTDVLRRERDGWLIVHHHAERVAAVPGGGGR